MGTESAKMHCIAVSVKWQNALPTTREHDIMNEAPFLERTQMTGRLHKRPANMIEYKVRTLMGSLGHDISPEVFGELSAAAHFYWNTSAVQV